MAHHATGSFDVKMSPLQAHTAGPDAAIGRFALDKQYHGPLDATSAGEMLSSGNGKDNGGYVAIEHVRGVLDGRRGTFGLQHNATMTSGVPALNIIVVPGSGTGDLAGLSGTMTIIIGPGGAHSYEFTYTLPDRQPPA